MLLRRIGQLLDQKHLRPVSFFQSLDRDNDGQLSCDEYVAGIASLGLQGETMQLRKLYVRIAGSELSRCPIGRLVVRGTLTITSGDVGVP